MGDSHVMGGLSGAKDQRLGKSSSSTNQERGVDWDQVD